MDFIESEKEDRFLQGIQLQNIEQEISAFDSASERSFLKRIEDFFIDRSRISLKEKAYFYHLMSVMVDSGVSLVKALKILAGKFQHPRFRRILLTLAVDVEKGKSLWSALSRFPDVFPEGECEVVRSGETIGNLDDMFERLSQQVMDDYTLRLKMRSALTYPSVVLVVLFLVLLVVTTWVIPRLAEFFILQGAELPFLTKFLIDVNQFFRAFWWIFVFVLVFFLLFFHFYISTEEGRFRWDYAKLKIPLIGELQKKIILARILRLFSILLVSGLSLLRISEILIRAVGNDVYRRKLSEVDYEIRHGGRFAASLQESNFLFPDLVSAVLDIGERAGTLDQSASRLAKHYDQEILHSIQEVMALIEPILIVLVGLGVLFVALAILAPIFSLSALV